MKIYFASLEDLTKEVDAYVPTHEQGLILLKALARDFCGENVIARARLKRAQDYEERFIGTAGSPDYDYFIARVERMGQ
jgi:hypothetical protein